MKVIRCIFLITVLMLSALSVYAQSYSLKGVVTNKKDQPLGNVQLTLQKPQLHTVTDQAGAFSFSDLEAGNYTITISHVGYQTLRRSVDIDHSSRNSLTFQLSIERYKSPSVVVTATRSRRDIEEVPEPVTVISDKEIQTSGSTRLSEILAEQTGLTLTSDHGVGIQVQGFSSDYTKIMIDGQPLIGRTAGTLNLDRISVGNVQQVEMIKGPSSALWGSDALAGVINIITQKGQRPFELGVNSRYATNKTGDLGLNLSTRKNNWQQHFYLNRNSSGGYRLQPNSIAQTVPSYHNYTTSYQTSFPISEAVEVEFQGRYYREKQSSTSYIGEATNPTLLDGDALQEDYSLAPTINFNLGTKTHAELSHYFSRYRTDTRYQYQQGDSLYEYTQFDQYLNKSELQLNHNWSDRHISTLGSGYKHEQLKAQRYAGDPAFNSYFIFAQHEWMPTKRWDIIAGLRYNGHSEYTSQLSPKFSTRYKLFDWLHLRASSGSGFKSPDFRQLFLNFTNPTVGYSVFGSSTVRNHVQELQERGQISEILTPLDQLKEIRAEQSWAYNAGVDLYPTNQLELRINLFHNDVSDLIESAPIATKNNGQSIYSYFNLEDVYTRGIEAQLRWEPAQRFELSAGYQLLDARRKIAGTRTIQNDQGEVVEKSFSSFKPMFNRSKHTGNLKLYYFWESLNIDANIRGTWHGPYGRADTNGNSYVDSDEYKDGYMIWDTAVAKTFKERYTLRMGIDNVLDFTRASDLSYLPGRIFYARISLQLY
jgi:outer membrane receptor for ferrienterochelin and colicins